jgi:cystathionine beta-lyase
MSENFVVPNLAELRQRKSEKWRGFPSDVLPLPVAEMDFPIAEPIKDALRDMIDRSDTGYLGAIPELKESFSIFAKKLWGWELDSQNVRIASDVGVAAVEILRVLIKPGDKVLIDTPVYHNFFNWLNEVKAEVVEVPMRSEELHYTYDLAGIESAYKSGVKVHLLCHPQNPTGTVHAKADLQKIADLAVEYGVTVISDEIHAPLTYVTEDFYPFLAISDNARRVGITITSASKSFNIAGLKCAIIVSQDERLNDLLATMPMAVHFRASLFGGVASAAAFAHGSSWLTTALGQLDENRRLLDSLIRSRIPAIKYRIPDCSYLAWLDLSALNLGDNPAATLLERGRVALNAGHTYGAPYSQFVRMNFATSPELITDGIERILKAI